jgi:hypothetical protein
MAGDTGNVAAMSPTRSPTRTRARSWTPALRLLPDLSPIHSRAQPEPLRGHDVRPPPLRVIDGHTHILLAGSDAGRRAALLDELTKILSASTVFAEADAVCEVLEHAPGSRMAIIAGDLDDASAESLMHMLAHRHPDLPVLIVDNLTRNTGEHIRARHDELRIQRA